MLRSRQSVLSVLPSIGAIAVFVYGFVIWTIYISFTSSRMVPRHELVGLRNYSRLWSSARWEGTFINLIVFAALFTGLCIVLGLLLAILLDQKIRGQAVFRTIYLYPMALSFIVTGNVWKWILNPGLGIEAMVRSWGFEQFGFDWIINRDMAIYTIVVAAVWQSAGFVMAIFLAALRSLDKEIFKAASMDGARGVTLYRRIVIPQLRPVFFSVTIILVHLATKTFDLVVAMTAGGPGYASDLPATFMYDMAFRRNELGIGAASAIMMLVLILAIIVPYIYFELRNRTR